MKIETLLVYSAPLIGFISLLIGIAAISRPQLMSKQFGIAADGPSLPFVVGLGARDIFMGLTLLIVIYLQLWAAIGPICLSLSFVAVCDFLVVRKYGNKKASLFHLAAAIATAFYGILVWIYL